MKTCSVVLGTEMKLALRDFFTTFFTLVFPSLMLLIFGSLFGTFPGEAGATMLDDMTPAYSCMVMGVTGLMGLPLTLTANMERGVYKRFDASPAGRLPIIWGELAAQLILTLAGLVILFLFAWAVFGVSARGSWLSIGGAACLSTAALFAIGFLLAAAVPGPRAALAVCYTVYFLMMFLSGATLPRQLFSPTLLAVSDWLPMTYAVRLMQDTFNATDGGSTQAAGILLLTAATGAAGGSFLGRQKR